METASMQDSPNGIRLAIAGGGTGGHVLPALAVAEELRHRSALREALWVGSRDGLEREAAANANIPFVAIPTGKLRRYLSLRNVTDAARVPLGMVAARKRLRAFSPDVVLSTGGFVSVPTVIAACGIAPVLTHEQTAILGLATRINAKFAAVLAVAHQQSAEDANRIHNYVIVTGNPVRPALTNGDRTRGRSWLGFDESLPVVYVTGGARGASPINQRIGALLPNLLEVAQVVHQTGPASANADAESLRQLREALPDPLRHRYRVFEFVRDELPDVYAATDLVVSRSGAGTIAELAYVGLPAILIPLPGAGGDEQTANARVLSDIGAAVVLPQINATPARLREEIQSILTDPARRARMADAARSVSQPKAASHLADALLSMASHATSPLAPRNGRRGRG
jgi:UDP-N-acetylglucosamine--N-acetylmuramyl-(pentapeptide) pyrophosphoryl-undecaprenol N-acetylglucosamine transferase